MRVNISGRRGESKSESESNSDSGGDSVSDSDSDSDSDSEKESKLFITSPPDVGSASTSSSSALSPLACKALFLLLFCISLQ